MPGFVVGSLGSQLTRKSRTQEVVDANFVSDNVVGNGGRHATALISWQEVLLMKIGRILIDG